LSSKYLHSSVIRSIFPLPHGNNVILSGNLSTQQTRGWRSRAYGA